MKTSETVVLYAPDYIAHGKTEVSTRLITLTARLAEVKGTYSGMVGYPNHLVPGNWYFVPVFTLVKPHGSDLEIQGHKIKDEDDLFGGVVPYEHMTSKAIMHGSVKQRVDTPQGWKRRFTEETEGIVLPGYTIFDRAYAPSAAKLLTKRGFTPLGKETRANSGDGQRILRTEDDLQQALADIPDDELRRFGYVVEAGLQPETVKTLSVGRVAVEDIEFTYYGKQKITTDIAGKSHYGGTDMYLVRGGFDDLSARVRSQSQQELAIKGLEKQNILLAIDQAKTFDEYALRTLHIFGSRRNYDIVQGYTEDGEFHSGVTDQSWRIGGASGPEILGLQEFRKNIVLQTLRGSSFSLYSEYKPNGMYGSERDSRIPHDAEVFFEGVEKKRYEGKLTSGATINTIPLDSYEKIK